MKIAPPITPQHMPPVVPPKPHAAPLSPLHPGPVTPEETTQALAHLDAALAERGQVSNQRDQAAVINGLQSQATRSLERTHQLIAHYYKGLDAATRSLRRQLQGRQLRNPKETLAHILDSCGDNPAVAHRLMQAAARQAKDEGDDGEHLFFRRQLKLLCKEHGKPGRNRPNPLKARERARGKTLRKTAPDALYSAAVNGPLNVVGLVDALLGEMREHGQFETSLREIRSDMAADVASAAAANALQQARPLMNGLATARHVAALLRECEHLLGRMRSKNPDMQVEGIALLRHLLTLIGKLMEPEQTRTLVELLGGSRLRNQLACLNELKRILNQRLPVRLWRTTNDYTNVQKNLLILSTVLTNEEQRLAQENSALWNA
ncbi:TyeA family type III secretion system gatekeeper subunit [Pseudomonas typographi]|uniref:TyeA family type III secretion system gatekeeper subunit n=1 Tax=Pseudomonas typographi TaxID=2715964 RepID=A0ABR7Z7C2_9PSED|nr:TyeA family type III secretion system gatekeeper subunit [Pseudomonas typographi]MBD1554521.1 TyeA family type III secretion system gatekeeper subunit [Pseudomonas typographi]MBD1589569.1 TyeA family type III secretion system gatekeeper subunit [Pseudomonas typographi]MBD1601365.1 TyeA family type III secretion system gatekeeper subunit [Pseudomonas typographi]